VEEVFDGCAAERVARSYGLEIFDVQLRRESSGTVLRVIIDRPDPGLADVAHPSGARERPAEDARSSAADAARSGDESIGIADCQRVSQDLSALLDVEEEELEAELADAYTLEVSSPGLDRPLRHEADYRRFTGRLAKIVTAAPIGGQSAFAGRLKGVDAGVVLLEEGRRVHRVPVAQIKRGRLDVEF